MRARRCAGACAPPRSTTRRRSRELAFAFQRGRHAAATKRPGGQHAAGAGARVAPEGGAVIARAAPHCNIAVTNPGQTPLTRKREGFTFLSSPRRPKDFDHAFRNHSLLLPRWLLLHCRSYHRPTTITGAGATFRSRLRQIGPDEYKKAINVAMNYQSIGSGGGIKRSSRRPWISVPPTCR